MPGSTARAEPAHVAAAAVLAAHAAAAPRVARGAGPPADGHALDGGRARAGKLNNLTVTSFTACVP